MMKIFQFKLKLEDDEIEYRSEAATFITAFNTMYRIGKHQGYTVVEAFCGNGGIQGRISYPEVIGKAVDYTEPEP